MSNTPNAASPHSPAGTEPLPGGAPTAAVSPLPEGVVPGYWAVVSKRFYRSGLTRMAVAYAAFVVFMAVFVPFIANSAPYTVELPDESGQWHRHFPLLANLGRVDVIILIVAGCLLAYLAQHYRVRGQAPDRRGRQRWQAFLMAVGTFLALGVAAIFFYPDRLDKTDYKAKVAAGTARSALFAPIPWGYADQEPLEADMTNKPPSRAHWLGTDLVGRDALARLLWSTRVVLGIGLCAELIAIAIGLIYGAIMGYFAGVTDILGMRFVEMVEAIPTLFLIIIFVSIFGRKVALIMLILGLTSWTGVARFVRAEYLRIRNLDYVTSAIAAGLPLRSVLFRHILPNALSPVLVIITFGIAGAVTSESILSFLGLGIEPPTPSWGAMLNEAGNPAEVFRPWLALGPGVMIFLTIFACNIIGESLRDALDPRLTQD